MTLKSKFTALVFLLLGSLAFSSTSFAHVKEIKVTSFIESEYNESETLIISVFQSETMIKTWEVQTPVKSMTRLQYTLRIDTSKGSIYFEGKTGSGDVWWAPVRYLDKDIDHNIDPQTTKHVVLHSYIPHSSSTPPTFTYKIK